MATGIKFFVIFEAIARCYFFHRKRLNKIPILYEDCPVVCPGENKSFDYDRVKLCEACPKFIAREKFKADFYQLINLRFSEREAKKIKFEKYLPHFYRTINLKNQPPDKMSVRTAAFIGIFHKEEAGFDKAENKN